MALILRVLSQILWFQSICSCLLIYWSQIVKKKNPIAVKKLIESRKISTASTVLALIFLNCRFCRFFYSLGSRKMLTGLMSL